MASIVRIGGGAPAPEEPEQKTPLPEVAQAKRATLGAKGAKASLMQFSRQKTDYRNRMITHHAEDPVSYESLHYGGNRYFCDYSLDSGLNESEARFLRERRNAYIEQKDPEPDSKPFSEKSESAKRAQVMRIEHNMMDGGILSYRVFGHEKSEEMVRVLSERDPPERQHILTVILSALSRRGMALSDSAQYGVDPEIQEAAMQMVDYMISELDMIAGKARSIGASNDFIETMIENNIVILNDCAAQIVAQAYSAETDDDDPDAEAEAIAKLEKRCQELQDRVAELRCPYWSSCLEDIKPGWVTHKTRDGGDWIRMFKSAKTPDEFDLPAMPPLSGLDSQISRLYRGRRDRRNKYYADKPKLALDNRQIMAVARRQMAEYSTASNRLGSPPPSPEEALEASEAMTRELLAHHLNHASLLSDQIADEEMPLMIDAVAQSYFALREIWLAHEASGSTNQGIRGMIFNNLKYLCNRLRNVLLILDDNDPDLPRLRELCELVNLTAAFGPSKADEMMRNAGVWASGIHGPSEVDELLRKADIPATGDKAQSATLRSAANDHQEPQADDEAARQSAPAAVDDDAMALPAVPFNDNDNDDGDNASASDSDDMLDVD